jgi:hypothetical protein
MDKKSITLQHRMLDELCKLLFKKIVTQDDWEFFLRYTKPENLPYPISDSPTTTTYNNAIFGLDTKYLKKWVIFILNKNNILYPIVRVPYSDNMILNKYHNIITMMKIIKQPPELKIHTVSDLEPQIIIYNMSLDELYVRYMKKMSTNMLFSSSNINYIILEYANIKSYIM